MDYQTLIERKLEPQGISGKDIIYICPNPDCDDKSGHLYVSYDKEKWHCFKCGIGGQRLDSLLRFLNISIDFDYEKLYKEHESSLDSIIAMKNSKQIETEIVDYSKDLDVLTQYYLLHIKPLSQVAYQYLLDRGLTPYMISKLCIFEGVNRHGETFIIKGQEFIGRDYSGRVIIPSLRKDGKISFYLGRDITGMKSNKYVNPSSELIAASEDVWSLEIIQTRSVVICEGVFSAIAVNRALHKLTACATYGKSIAETSSNIDVRVTSQGEKLLSKEFDTYIMFYDKDAKKEAYNNAMYLYERGAKVKVVNIPDNMYGSHADAGDMTDEEIINLIMNAEDFDPMISSLNGLM